MCGCTLQHLWPVGKKCQYEVESLASHVEDSAPPSMDPASVATVLTKYCFSCSGLVKRWMLWIGGCSVPRQHLDKDLSRQVLLLILHTVISVQNLESHGINTEDTVESVVPSLGYLRNNTSIQAEVDKKTVRTGTN